MGLDSNLLPNLYYSSNRSLMGVHTPLIVGYTKTSSHQNFTCGRRVVCGVSGLLGSFGASVLLKETLDFF